MIAADTTDSAAPASAREMIAAWQQYAGAVDRLLLEQRTHGMHLHYGDVTIPIPAGLMEQLMTSLRDYYATLANALEHRPARCPWHTPDLDY